jgi:oxaloacetate decarboxylase alpha subunit
MLSNLESQLKEQGAADKIDEVLKEIAVVQKDSGYPPLVTPTSQIVGTQAVFNVLFGRYNKLSGEFQDLVAGKYGSCPAPKNPDVVKKALVGLKMEKEITHRPADDIPAEYSKLEDETKKLLGTGTVSPEDVLTYAMFPKVAPDFFKKRGDGPVVFKPEAEAPAAKGGTGGVLIQPGNYSINVNGTNYTVAISPPSGVPAGGAAPASAPAAAPVAGSGTIVPAPVAGTVLRYVAAEGSEIKSGDTILIIESMKMELEIKAASAGKIHFLVPAGTQVKAQQPVAEIYGAMSASAPAATPGAAAPSAGAASSGAGVVVPAPVAGTVLRYAVNEGDQIASGVTIFIIESMKMELEIKAIAAGKVHFLVPIGTQVASQQPVAEIR